MYNALNKNFVLKNNGIHVCMDIGLKEKIYRVIKTLMKNWFWMIWIKN